MHFQNSNGIPYIKKIVTFLKKTLKHYPMNIFHYWIFLVQNNFLVVALPNMLSRSINNYNRKSCVPLKAVYYFYILLYIIIFLKYKMIWQTWFRNLKQVKCNKQPDKESKNCTTATMIMLMIVSSNFVFLLRSCGNYRKHIFRKRWWVFGYVKITSLKKDAT